MGANNVLPAVPTFTQGAPTIAQLNALSYAASFLCDYDVRPIWSFFMWTATQSVPSATWTNISYDHTAYDSDGVQSYPYAVIKTQGYYVLQGAVQIEASSGTGDMAAAAFLFTAGANNPHYATNATQFFGYRGIKLSSTAQAAADNSICIQSPTPLVCYPGDKLSVSLYLSAAHTVDINQNPNTSYIQGRFATKFSGRWLRTGT